MVRDPYEEETSQETQEEIEDMGEIPIPSCTMMEMGIVIP
jgi:hypothetical protein